MKSIHQNICIFIHFYFTFFLYILHFGCWIFFSRQTRAQSLEPPPWLQGNSISGSSYTQLANMYDAYQIILIQSRATEITNSAADVADDNSSDGPGGQEGQ